MTLFAEASIITPHSTGRGKHGPAHLGKKTKTVVIVDPLRKLPTVGVPIPLPKPHEDVGDGMDFPCGSAHMQGKISLCSETTCRHHRRKHPGLILAGCMEQLPSPCRQRCSSIQIPPLLDDLLQGLDRVTHWTSPGNRSSTSVLVPRRLENHSENMDLRHFSRPLGWSE